MKELKCSKQFFEFKRMKFRLREGREQWGLFTIMHQWDKNIVYNKFYKQNCLFVMLIAWINKHMMSSNFEENLYCFIGFLLCSRELVFALKMLSLLSNFSISKRYLSMNHWICCRILNFILIANLLISSSLDLKSILYFLKKGLFLLCIVSNCETSLF